ncbi:dnaJ homolog subfamily C member 1-like [Babylonia areolata]|uniref:dnaJ homolog subfamily C member 1-like n=1 Tax=Babylonia areolata TaxID=304850 RepID=UPI003FCFD490
MAAAARLIRISVFLLIFNRCLTWDNFELELFDLVEEVNANFYDLLGVGQDASAADIRKAYRKLTLQLHPDKNKADDAEEKFRQLVAVYEVLKDEERRQMYNRILVEGLPDWKTPVFYYRRARKMGFVELSALLALIITIGQYLFGWAVYIEKRLTLEDKIDSKKKKERKKKTKASEEAEELEEEMASLPRPSVLNLWPFRLPGFIFWCAWTLPVMVKEQIAEHRRRKQEEEEEEEEEDNEVSKVVRKPKRRKMDVPEYSADQYEATAAVLQEEQSASSADQQLHLAPSVKGGEWSEEELVLLAKAVNKFPGGTPKRWEKIANMVGRSVDEVCAKSKTVKSTYTMNLSSAVQGDVLTNTSSKMAKKNQHISDSIITTSDDNMESAVGTATDTSDPDRADSGPRQRHRPTKIPKTIDRTLMISQAVPSKDSSTTRGRDPAQDRSDDGGGGGDSRTEVEVGGKEGESWTQNQQVIFEWALRHFPKGTDKRWDKIAEQIPGKTKEDCILRFKYLAELVKKKKGDN